MNTKLANGPDPREQISEMQPLTSSTGEPHTERSEQIFRCACGRVLSDYEVRVNERWREVMRSLGATNIPAENFCELCTP